MRHFYHVSFPYGTFTTKFAHIGSTFRRTILHSYTRMLRPASCSPPNLQDRRRASHSRVLSTGIQPKGPALQKEKDMIIGVPKEIKDNEARVGITPAGVKALTEAGHKVLVETQAGALSGFPDEEYQNAGAEIVGDAGYVWGKSDMVVKVKEPIEREYVLLPRRPGPLHLSPPRAAARSHRQTARVKDHRHRLRDGARSPGNAAAAHAHERSRRPHERAGRRSLS